MFLEFLYIVEGGIPGKRVPEGSSTKFAFEFSPLTTELVLCFRSFLDSRE